MAAIRITCHIKLIGSKLHCDNMQLLATYSACRDVMFDQPLGRDPAIEKATQMNSASGVSSAVPYREYGMQTRVIATPGSNHPARPPHQPDRLLSVMLTTRRLSMPAAHSAGSRPSKRLPPRFLQAQR